MYNLTVDEAHTFFVGDGAWLVHNIDCPVYGIYNLYETVEENLEFNKNSIEAIQPYSSGEGHFAGWTGAFDMKGGKFLLLPSDRDSTFLKGVTPNTHPFTIVPRQQGHPLVLSALNQRLRLTAEEIGNRVVGFHIEYPVNNVFNLGWFSRGLNNTFNPYSDGAGFVAITYRNTILDAVRKVLPAEIKVSSR
jgi:hypothetical protein